MKNFIFILVVTFFLNLVWEKSQMFLYVGDAGLFDHWERCMLAAIGDVVLIGIIFILQTLVLKDIHWFVNMDSRKWFILFVLSVLVATVVEKWGLAAGRWAYNDYMPILPILRVGVAPLFQMVVLVPVITLYTKYQTQKI